MREQSIFQGAATAWITPLNEQGVDYPALKKLIEWQIEQGINALVICGTAGEGSTLTDEEHREALRFSAEVVAGRVPMIAGTGSNDTAYAIDLTKFACEIGYDAMLADHPMICAIKEANGDISKIVETAVLGFCDDYLRLPLTPMEEEHRAVLLQRIRELGLNV